MIAFSKREARRSYLSGVRAGMDSDEAEGRLSWHSFASVEQDLPIEVDSRVVCASFTRFSRIGLCSIAFAVATYVAACRAPTGETDLEFMIGNVVADRGVTIIPGWRWRPHSEDGGRFRNYGQLFVHVEGASEDDLVFSVTPDGTHGNAEIHASWDDEPLPGGKRKHPGDPLLVDIPKSRLSPGDHRLVLSRGERKAQSNDPDEGGCAFSEVTVYERHSERVLLRGIRPDMFLAAFFEYGVTGFPSVRRPGLLFIGPQRLDANIRTSRERTASFVLHNHSGSNATFRVSIGDRAPLDFTVAGHSSLPVAFDLPRGSHRTKFEVEGLPDGAFLWGSPYLRPNADNPPGPPIILLTLDTTRRDAISPWGPAPQLTPNIARLASRASVYTNAWATSPWTLPSHASIFTGLYPSHHGAGVTDDRLARGAVTVATVLRGSGYTTGGFVGGPLAGAMFGLAQGFLEYHDPEGWERTADGVTDRALEFIADNAGSPFFLFVNYFDPHEPYDAPEQFEKRWLADPDVDVGLRMWANAASPDDAALRRAYMVEVGFMDSQIGRLLEGLRRQGLYDEAMIIAVADHGEFLGEDGLYGHSYRLDPELTSVPLIIKWPNQGEPDRISALVSHVDLFNTMISAAKISTAPSDGRTLVGDDHDVRAEDEIVFMEEHFCRIHQLLGPNRLADHLFGLQWSAHREVLIGRRLECEGREAGAWQPIRCDRSWEAAWARLTDRMRAVTEIEVRRSIADLEEGEAERLRALGYLN